MFHRLNDRSNLRSEEARGISCDLDGVFLGGDCPLVTPVAVTGAHSYQLRAEAEVRDVLLAGYGEAIDIGKCIGKLRRIADLMSANRLGLAQIMAIQMRLPELTDDQAIRRVAKADRLLRFNPNHKPPGPGGGQFTSASDTTAASRQSTDAAEGRPHQKSIPQLSFRTTSGDVNMPFWAVAFQLSRPSVLGGYIVQKIETRYETTSNRARSDPPIWEAFPVNAGSDHTTILGSGTLGGGDDLWAGQVGLDGEHGVQIDTGAARFYEGLTQDQLVQHGFTFGGASISGPHIRSTTKDPKLPTNRASNIVVRVSKNEF